MIKDRSSQKCPYLILWNNSQIYAGCLVNLQNIKSHKYKYKYNIIIKGIKQSIFLLLSIISYLLGSNILQGILYQNV